MTNRIANTFRTGLALACAVFAVSAFAQQRELLPAKAGDLVPPRALAAERGTIASSEREPLEFFQSLSADTRLSLSPPYQADSREYWQRVDGDALRAGYELALTAPGAVVLISPSTRAQALRLDQVAIRSGGARVDFAQAADTLVDADALRAAGMDASAGAVGFRLRDGYEQDAAVIVDAADGDYVVHVLEANSEHRLQLQSRVDTVYAGAELKLDLALVGGSQVDSAAALLIAPDGSSHELRVAGDKDGHVVEGRVPTKLRAQAGLWDVHASVAADANGRLFQRDARTAVAVVAPTARLAGDYEWYSRRVDGAIVLSFGVEVATAGRYELRGVLYGHDDKGELVPLGIAHAAAWSEPGRGELSLSFPVLDRGDVSGPFELRDLRLSDQSAASLLERREHAVTLR